MANENTTDAKLVQIIKQSADLSAFAWQMAIERAAGPTYRATATQLAAECATAYSQAAKSKASRFYRDYDVCNSCRQTTRN